MDAHLAKPVTLDVLGATIGRVSSFRDESRSPRRTGDRGVSDASPASDPEALPVLDAATWERLARLEAKSGEGLRNDLVRLFLESLSRHREKLANALAEESAEEIVEAAHSIKGSAGNLGGMRVHAAARETERAVRSLAPEEWSGPVSRLRRELREFENELARRLEG